MSKGLIAVTKASVAEALAGYPMPSDELALLVDGLGQAFASSVRAKREFDVNGLNTKLESVPWYRLGHHVPKEIRPSRYVEYLAGEYYIQDAGSMLALAVARSDTESLRGKVICDLCAAPGGKATSLLEAVSDDGFLLANEPIRSRMPALAFNLAKVGSGRYAISSMDPEQLAEAIPGAFDLVLVDAPCSGQAMMSRGGQTVSALSDRQIQHSASRQNRILDAARRLLRPGGNLVYSTCTFTPAENEQQVERLIQSGAMTSVSLAELHEYRSEISPECYRVWPHRDRCSGSFAAKLRIEDSQCEPERAVKSRKEKTKLPCSLDGWFSTMPVFRGKLTENVFYVWPDDVPAWVERVAQGGPELVHRTGKTWKPAHAAAIRRDPGWNPVARFAVGREQAIKYYSGEPIECPERGWNLVMYGDLPLGWVKSDGRIGKNQLPSAARVQGSIQ